MTCQLILMRHAKSGHDDPSLSDHDRPLAPRGRRDSPRMAEWLAQQGLVPDLVLCSSSTRTCQTADLMLPCWDTSPELVLTEDLYLAAPHHILATIHGAPKGFRRVMVLAHNPGISMLASALAGKLKELKTAAIAVYDVNADVSGGQVEGAVDPGAVDPFAEIGNDVDCRLTHLVSPRTIEAGADGG